MLIGSVEHKTNVRFKNMDDFESYINAKVFHYDSEDVIFTGYIYKTKTLQFKVVKQSAYAKGANSMKKIDEYCGQSCYIATSDNYFINGNNFLTGKDYTEELLTFIRFEQR